LLESPNLAQGFKSAQRVEVNTNSGGFKSALNSIAMHVLDLMPCALILLF